MQLTLTTAGIAALINAENTGTAPVRLDKVGVTSVAFAPTPALAAVPAELKRMATIGGSIVADDVLHVLLRDESADTYTVRGIGLYLEGGILFGTYSQAEPISTKAAASVLLLAIDVRFAALDAALIEFGDTDFIDPPATDARAGVVELATNAEALAGTDAQRAITPAALKFVRDNTTIPDATTAVKGRVQLATAAQTQEGASPSLAVTPAGLNARTATTARTGLVELATGAEARAGTDAQRAVTPAALAEVLAAIPGLPRAYASFVGRSTSGACAVSRGANIASVTRSDLGYSVVFANPMPAASYLVLSGLVGVNETINVAAGSKTVAGFRFHIQTGQANDGNGRVDPPEVYFSVVY